MVTLKDIALEAGVSQVTVSNVIHKKYKKVSAEKIEQINRLIEEHNYIPNANARSLALKKSMIIGIIIPNVADDFNFLESSYNAELIGGIEKVIRNSGYFMMVRGVRTSADAVPLLETWNVDGVIFLGAYSEDVDRIKRSLKLPVLFVDTYSSEDDFSNVRVNDEKGGYLATRYLINCGHRNICFVGPDISEEGVVLKRYEGYQSALRECGLEDCEMRIFAQFANFECGIEIGKRIAFSVNTITAVLVTADILALGIMEGIRLSGKKIPNDISVVGFDNIQSSQWCLPKLTTITQYIPQKAEIIAKTLLEMLSNPEGCKSISKTIDVDLIERNSVKTI